jgi:hypothetical protein
LLHPAGYIESVLGRAAIAVPGSTAGGAAAR